jgi:hypothetical protein
MNEKNEVSSSPTFPLYGIIWRRSFGYKKCIVARRGIMVSRVYKLGSDITRLMINKNHSVYVICSVQDTKIYSRSVTSQNITFVYNAL